MALPALLAGCSWTLPEPQVRLDARSDVAADAVRDAPPIDEGTETPDVPVAVDLGTDRGFVDLGTDRGGADVVVADAGFDAGRADAGFDADTPVDLGVMDVAFDRGVDAPDAPDLGVDTGEVRCTPGDRRACYPGPAASRGRGQCRDGVETCDAGGRWSGTCANAIVPDCTGRTCGSDDCGGTCGSCPSGQVCDEVGRCAVPSCGASSFTVPCGKDGVCPANSNCTVDSLCSCLPGYVARTCAGVDCGTSCSYPDWYCARAGFCAGGAVACRSGFTCPRHAVCNEDARTCTCAPGYTAVNCSGDRCTACPGTDYRCVPAS